MKLHVARVAAENPYDTTRDIVNLREWREPVSLGNKILFPEMTIERLGILS